jgi:hypothetical protein
VKALPFWKAVTRDRSKFLERLIALYAQNGVRFAVIGGEAVNAYAAPLVGLDLDIAVATDDASRVERLLGGQFKTERFPFSIDVSDVESDLRVRVHTDPRYGDFVERAEMRQVLGLDLPVAPAADVIKGKVWAASDPTRRPAKRAKDILDIARMLEVMPELEAIVPPEILSRLPGRAT